MTHTPKRIRRTFDCPEQEVYLNLWRTYDRLRELEEALFAAHDLTAQQYNALRLLKSIYPRAMPTLQLASRLISRAPDITRLLDKLEASGLITRDRLAENRRIVQVSITPAGLELLKRLARPVRECARQQLGHLTPEQQQQLIALLQAARLPHEDDSQGW